MQKGLALMAPAILFGFFVATQEMALRMEDCGIAREKIHVTGKKLTDKLYQSHSGYPGGFKAVPLGKVMAERPEEAIKRAVWGMLPHNVLGRAMFKKLKVYTGADHPHKAQSPAPLGF